MNIHIFRCKHCDVIKFNQFLLIFVRFLVILSLTSDRHNFGSRQVINKRQTASILSFNALSMRTIKLLSKILFHMHFNERLGIDIIYKLMIISHVKSVVIWVFRRIKTLMIILCELTDFIEVILIKVNTLYAEVSLDRFSKDLRFVCVRLGDFVIMLQCWIVALSLWPEKIFDFKPRLVLACL